MKKPAYSFTVPSLHDGISLEVRLYHPAAEELWSPSSTPAAVLAHPYAPLGGSQDDAVILFVAQSLLKKGFVVVTFNFRGAGESDGRTSLTGRAEIDDYASAIGFVVYYMHHMNVARQLNDSLRSGAETSPERGTQHTIRLLLGGYSFGSLVLARLPPLAGIMKQFEAAQSGSPAEEIFLRARTLATQTQTALGGDNQSPSKDIKGECSTSPPSRDSLIIVGGDESERQAVRDSRRSVEFVHEVSQRIKSHMPRRRSSQANTALHQKQPVASKSVHSETIVETAFLLISPVLLPLSTVLLPPGLALPASKDSTGGTSGFASLERPSLILFGSSDTFTKATKLQEWAEKLERDSSGVLQWANIETAGHFWREAGVLQTLGEKIDSWLHGSHIL